MKQNDTRQKGTRVRERATFSYDVSSGDPDLKEQIIKLRSMRNSPYWNRSFADIAGMILMKAVPKEIQTYEKGDSR